LKQYQMPQTAIPQKNEKLPNKKRNKRLAKDAL
jgi:hypothetical protein